MKSTIMPVNWQVELEHIEKDSIGEDFLLFEETVISPAFDSPFKVDVITAVICTKGTMQGAVNMKNYTAEAPCLFIILPDQILQFESLSEDFKGYFIVMSQRFANNLFLNVQERFPLYLSVNDNPWTPLSDGELEGMMYYYNMLKTTLKMTENPHRTEIVKHLTQAFFYGLSYQYHKLPENEKKSKQELLVEQFLTLVQTNFKEQRGVEFYADKLCLTPKYLSKLIKDNSGKSAAEWIDNYVVLEAKALLKSTNLTVQQLSDELNFPSQSFFGKYFKRHVGVSPKEYRKK